MQESMWLRVGSSAGSRGCGLRWSVAIADRYAAVYPTDSPGGWHLLGSTTVTLFDVTRDEPATLMPGTTVRFVAG